MTDDTNTPRGFEAWHADLQATADRIRELIGTVPITPVSRASPGLLPWVPKEASDNQLASGHALRTYFGVDRSQRSARLDGTLIRYMLAPDATPERLLEAADPATCPARLERLVYAPQAPLRHRALSNPSLSGEILRPHLGAGEVWAWLNPCAFVEAMGLTASEIEWGTRAALTNILARFWAASQPAYNWRHDPQTTLATLVRRAQVATRTRLGGGASPDELTADQARAVVETVALVVGAPPLPAVP
jgi:hypothetical protein